MLIPGINGMEICRRLRADDRTGGMPLLLLTGREDEEARAAALAAGKPTAASAVPPSGPSLLRRVQALLLRGRATEAGRRTPPRRRAAGSRPAAGVHRRPRGPADADGVPAAGVPDAGAWSGLQPPGTGRGGRYPRRPRRGAWWTFTIEDVAGRNWAGRAWSRRFRASATSAPARRRDPVAGQRPLFPILLIPPCLPLRLGRPQTFAGQVF